MSAPNLAPKESSDGLTVIRNPGPLKPSGVTVVPQYANRYAGEPDGFAYATSTDGTKRYVIEMRPTQSPVVRVVSS